MDKLAYLLRLKRSAPVLRQGHPILRTTCVGVKPSEITTPGSACAIAIKDLKSVFDSPYHTVIGLSAPQVGHPLRIIAYKISDPKTIKEKKVTASPLTFLINPTLEILEHKSKWQAEYESCESMPHYNCIVRRPGKVKVDALNVKGEKVSFTAEGFLAKVLHHEVDHLDGITLVDRALEKTLRHDQHIDVYENYPSNTK
ncbi:UNVERIFIED_CONTAM: hypothetical protein HDU68_004807 [Siphonaria sp. JEL0065]|nr:hypothetical protein HDU68_004807 [Siphonaria sp. JEL0065]